MHGVEESRPGSLPWSLGLVESPAFDTQPELDQKLRRLRSETRTFARLGPQEKARLLHEVRARFVDLAPKMVELGARAKGIDPESNLAGEEWFSGPAISLRALRVFAQALEEIERYGAPRVPPALSGVGSNGGTRIPLVPRALHERALYLGWSGEAWLQNGSDRVFEKQASFYGLRDPEGQVTLVLGAGNVASISVLDVLYHSFVTGAVCLLKMSPVNAYLGPLYEQAFQPLISRGFLAIAHGGPEQGAYLCEHAAVDAIHVTGSAETHDRIVWGAPSEQAARKRAGNPRLGKTITSELGNVSPVLVVPDRYSDRELDAMAKNIAGMVIQNASFNCNAAKMLVLPKGFAQRDELLSRLTRSFAHTPARLAYYPGARQRYDALTRAAGSAHIQRFGDDSEGKLPWTLIVGLDAGSESPLFRTEPFCSIISETSVGSTDPVEFLQAAREFANQRLWGTLNAMILISPRLERDPRISLALDRTISDLRYGTVGVNLWPAVAYGLSVLPWGGHPSGTLSDVQSGLGFGHNAAMLEGVEKSVLRGPLVGFPEPLWYPRRRHFAELAEAVTHMESEPSVSGFLRTAWAGFR